MFKNMSRKMVINLAVSIILGMGAVGTTVYTNVKADTKTDEIVAIDTTSSKEAWEKLDNVKLSDKERRQQEANRKKMKEENDKHLAEIIKKFDEETKKEQEEQAKKEAEEQARLEQIQREEDERIQAEQQIKAEQEQQVAQEQAVQTKQEDVQTQVAQAETPKQAPVQARTDGFNFNGNHFDIASFSGSGHVPMWTNNVYRWETFPSHYLVELQSQAGQQIFGLGIGSEVVIDGQRLTVTSIMYDVPNNSNTANSIFTNGSVASAQVCTSESANSNLNIYFFN